MAEYYAVATGNFSSCGWNKVGGGDPLAWDAGTSRYSNLLVGDTLYCNNKIITLDYDLLLPAGQTGLVTITNSVASGVTANGKFEISNAAARILQATLLAVTGSVCFKTAASNGFSLTIKGNVTGGAAANSRGVDNASSGNVTIEGNVTGGTNASGVGVYSNSGGNVTVNGNVQGTITRGIHIAAGAATVVVGGWVKAGNNGHGIDFGGTGSIAVAGYVEAAGGSGICNSGYANIDVQGYVKGGTSATGSYGVYNMNGASVIVRGDIVGNAALCYGVYNYANGPVTCYGNIIEGVFGGGAQALGFGGNCGTLNLGNWTSANYFLIGGMKFPKQLLAAQVKKGVIHGDLVGSLSGGGGPFGRFRRIDK